MVTCSDHCFLDLQMDTSVVHYLWLCCQGNRLGKSLTLYFLDNVCVVVGTGSSSLYPYWNYGH